jgi:hypothetical protein
VSFISTTIWSGERHGVNHETTFLLTLLSCGAGGATDDCTGDIVTRIVKIECKPYTCNRVQTTDVNR